jgi:hypothetical protein
MITTWVKKPFTCFTYFHVCSLYQKSRQLHHFTMSCYATVFLRSSIKSSSDPSLLARIPQKDPPTGGLSFWGPFHW